MKNPNVLKGHEGELLQIVNELPEVKEVKIDSNGDVVDIVRFHYTMKPGTVVMFLTVSHEGAWPEHVRFLLDEKIYQFEKPVNSWMRYFIPWPRGGFVER